MGTRLIAGAERGTDRRRWTYNRAEHERPPPARATTSFARLQRRGPLRRRVFFDSGCADCHNVVGEHATGADAHLAGDPPDDRLAWDAAEEPGQVGSGLAVGVDPVRHRHVRTASGSSPPSSPARSANPPLSPAATDRACQARGSGYPRAMAETTLTKLGNPKARADRQLEVFETEDPTLEVTLHCSEFTCRCPITGQPDWARIEITYRPRRHIVESKSVKLYLETFREEGIFHEHLATTIRDDLVAALDPASLQVKVCFNSRGGIAIDAVSHHPEA